MTRYVAGFMFDEEQRHVVLILKNKPKWQEGLLNAIGGKIEESDNSSKDAMIREFREETGVLFEDWHHFLTMSGKNTDELKSDFSVDFFRCYSKNIEEVKSMEEEIIGIFLIREIMMNEYPVIDNIHWLINLALDKNPTFTTVVYE